MKPDGGPAFPNPSRAAPEDSDALFVRQPGMTLRDYFAAAAVSEAIRMVANWSEPEVPQADSMAKAAYAIADAMLAARDK